MCQYAVFTGYMHDITGDTDSHQVQVAFNFAEWYIIFLSIGLYQFKADATAGKLLIWIFAMALFRVEDGNCSRQFVAGQVVVANNKIEAFGIGVSNFIDRLNTAIKCNDQREIIVRRIVNSFGRDTVAFQVPVRHIIFQPIVKILKEAVNKKNGGCSVNIVIVVNKKQNTDSEGSNDPQNGLLHACHQER